MKAMGNGVYLLKRAKVGAAVDPLAGLSHNLLLFLLILTLVNLHIMSHENEQAKEQATARWVAWGVMFTMLGFFVITPEQEAAEKRMTQR